MKNKQQCTIYILRHGETEWNVEHRFQGQKDSPLTDRGVKQAEEVAEFLSSHSFDAVFSSDLLRAKRTAQIVAKEHKLAVTTTKLLREQSYGALEGKLISEARADLKEVFDEYDNLPDEKRFRHKFVEDMETDEMIAARFITYVREIAIAYRGKRVLFVCHGSLMAALLVHIGFAKQDGVRIANTGFFILETDGVEFSVKETSGITIINRRYG